MTVLKVVGPENSLGWRRVALISDETELEELIKEVKNGFFGCGHVTVSVKDEDLSFPTMYWMGQDGEEIM